MSAAIPFLRRKLPAICHIWRVWWGGRWTDWTSHFLLESEPPGCVKQCMHGLNSRSLPCSSDSPVRRIQGPCPAYRNLFNAVKTLMEIIGNMVRYWYSAMFEVHRTSYVFDIEDWNVKVADTGGQKPWQIPRTEPINIEVVVIFPSGSGVS